MLFIIIISIFNQVLLGFGLLSAGTKEERLEAAFDAFDTNPKDGQLDTAELRTLLITMCGVPVEAAGKRATSLMQAGDKDGDGQLDVREFVAAMISGAGGSLPNFIAFGVDSQQLKIDGGATQLHDLGEDTLFLDKSSGAYDIVLSTPRHTTVFPLNALPLCFSSTLARRLTSHPVAMLFAFHVCHTPTLLSSLSFSLSLRLPRRKENGEPR